MNNRINQLIMKNPIFFLFVVALFSCNKDDCDGRERLNLNPRIVDELNYMDLKSMAIVDEKGISTRYSVLYDHQRILNDIPFTCEEYLEVNIRNSINDFHVNLLSRASVQETMLQIILPNQTKFQGGLQFIFDKENNYSLPPWNKEGTLIVHNSFTVNDTIFTDKVVEISYPPITPTSIKRFLFTKGYGIIKLENHNGESLSFMR